MPVFLDLRGFGFGGYVGGGGDKKNNQG